MGNQIDMKSDIAVLKEKADQTEKRIGVMEDAIVSIKDISRANAIVIKIVGLGLLAGLSKYLMTGLFV